jgi:hypothetical protein
LGEATFQARGCVCLIVCSNTGKKSFSVFFAHYYDLRTLGRSSAAECDSGHTFPLYIPRHLEETAQSLCGAGTPFEELGHYRAIGALYRCKSLRCPMQRAASAVSFWRGRVGPTGAGLGRCSGALVCCLSTNLAAVACLSPVDCSRGDLQPTGMGLAGLLTTASSNIRRNSGFRVGLAGRFCRRELRNYLSECAV